MVYDYYYTICPYPKCNLGCKNIKMHRAKYANMRNKIDDKIETKPSSKINWKIYNDIFGNTDKFKIYKIF